MHLSPPIGPWGACYAVLRCVSATRLPRFGARRTLHGPVAHAPIYLQTTPTACQHTKNCAMDLWTSRVPPLLVVRLCSFSERRIARHSLNATVTIALKPHREGCHRCTRRRFGNFGKSHRDSETTNPVPTLYDLFYHIFYYFVALLGIAGTGASCINLILHLLIASIVILLDCLTMVVGFQLPNY